MKDFVILGVSITAPLLIMKAIACVVYTIKEDTVVTERLLRERREAEATERSATSASANKVEAIYNSQETNLARLNDLLRKTERSLVSAQQLFSERAYTPFWDSIEDAVESLREFDKRVNLINQSAKEYYIELEGRDHTFPVFPLKSDALPKPDYLIKILSERIAEAQRDFQFSSIFEQRRTTSAIVTGFRNTHEAIASLRKDIVRSMSDLQNSLESGLGSISSTIQGGFSDMAKSHEQSASELRETLDSNAKEVSERDTKHYEFTEGALDNIQNRRKPYSSETKDPSRRSDG